MNTIFTDQNTAHLFELFLWMLGAFLIGWLLSRIFADKKERIIEKEIIVEKKIFVDKIVYKDKEVTALNKIIYTPEPIPLNSNTETPNTTFVTNIKTTGANSLNFEGFGKATASEKDDLKRISGIGPSIENKLNGIGIFTYQQISKFTPKDMTDITDLITFFPGRIERDNWVQQAKNLVKGIATDFSTRVDKGDIY